LANCSRHDDGKPATSRPHCEPQSPEDFLPEHTLLRHQRTVATPVSSNFPLGSGTGTRLSG